MFRRRVVLLSYAVCAFAFLLHSYMTYTHTHFETTTYQEELSAMPLPVQLAFVVSPGLRSHELWWAGYKDDVDYFLGYSRHQGGDVRDVGWIGHFQSSEIKDSIDGNGRIEYWISNIEYCRIFGMFYRQQS